MISGVDPRSVGDRFAADQRPEWFERALATPVESGRVVSGGIGIAYSAWGDPEAPGLLFVHGGGANRRWWHPSAPLLSDRYRVAALDLGGHGDSDRRVTYDPAARADELVDVCAAAGIETPAVVVAHSMGGFVAVRTAAAHPDRVHGLVLLDSPLGPSEVAAGAAVHARRRFAAGRAYPSPEVAASRYRTLPEQDEYLPAVLRYVAEQSVARREGGWGYKTDMAGIEYPSEEYGEHLRRVRCEMAMIRAGAGMVDEAVRPWFEERLGRALSMDVVPDAGHHLMLDRPLEMLAAIERVLSAWSH